MTGGWIGVLLMASLQVGTAWAEGVVAPEFYSQIAPQQVSFTSSDDVTVYGDLYRADMPQDGPIVLLLHQSASNTTEFATVVPHLLQRRFHVLAIDARGGGGVNRTTARLEHHGGGAEAYHDFKAALRFIRERGFTGSIGIVGSSYSAGRIFQVLAERPAGVAAVASFSPGAAFARSLDGAPSWAEQVEIPVLMSWAPHELDDDRHGRFERVASQEKQLLVQESGVHGASTLNPDKNPEGWQGNLEVLLAFLDRYLSAPSR